MGHEWLDLYAPFRYQAEKFLHVAILGPAHIGQRVILTLLFIKRIITAGTISPRHQQFDFLAIHLVPGKAQLHCAYVDNTAAVPTNLYCKLARNSGFRGGSNDDAIHTLAIGDSADLSLKLLAASQCNCRS